MKNAKKLNKKVKLISENIKEIKSKNFFDNYSEAGTRKY